jgi:hypothetical protein
VCDFEVQRCAVHLSGFGSFRQVGISDQEARLKCAGSSLKARNHGIANII